MLERMRLDGLDRAWVPFAERHFLAWRGTPEPDMDAKTVINVLKVLLRTFPPTTCICRASQTARCETMAGSVAQRIRWATTLNQLTLKCLQ